MSFEGQLAGVEMTTGSARITGRSDVRNDIELAERESKNLFFTPVLLRQVTLPLLLCRSTRRAGPGHLPSSTAIALVETVESRPFPEFRRLSPPHVLPARNMRTRTRTRSATVPRPPQAIAALLPPEIVDCIFSHFDFDYAMDASREDSSERSRTLSAMSVIAEGWTGPARRLLCRTVFIGDWDELVKGVPEWARGVKNLTVDYSQFIVVNPAHGAIALFQLLESVPNLQRLHLSVLPFRSFSPAASKLMRTTPLLPHLRDLFITNQTFARPILADLLATSNYKITRLHVGPTKSEFALDVAERFDFGGNLRYLNVTSMAYEAMLRSSRVVTSSLSGLKELEVCEFDSRRSATFWREYTSRMRKESFSVIGLTLEKLTISESTASILSETFPFLTALTHLSLCDMRDSPAPLLLTLPPTLSFLRLSTDEALHDVLCRWLAHPSLVPDGLEQIRIDFIRDQGTLQILPPVIRLHTTYRPELFEMIKRLSAGALPFTTLEMSFAKKDLDRVELVKEECKRLNVEFRLDNELVVPLRTSPTLPPALLSLIPISRFSLTNESISPGRVGSNDVRIWFRNGAGGVSEVRRRGGEERDGELYELVDIFGSTGRCSDNSRLRSFSVFS